MKTVIIRRERNGINGASDNTVLSSILLNFVIKNKTYQKLILDYSICICAWMWRILFIDENSENREAHVYVLIFKTKPNEWSPLSGYVFRAE